MNSLIFSRSCGEDARGQGFTSLPSVSNNSRFIGCLILRNRSKTPVLDPADIVEASKENGAVWDVAGTPSLIVGGEGRKEAPSLFSPSNRVRTKSQISVYCMIE